MTKKILFEQLPPELFNLFQTMTEEIQALRKMIEEGEIGLSISQAEFNLALERITKLEEDMVSVQEQLKGLGITPEEIQTLLTSLTYVNDKINTLESYDKNSSQTFTAVMNRISTIEMNHLRLGANELVIPVTLTENIVLPSQDEYMNEIVWSSSDEDVLSIGGIITRPTAFNGDAQVVLTATLAAGANSIEKVFTVTVKALDYTDEEKLAITLQDFDSSVFIGVTNEFGAVEITENQVLPLEVNEATITWSSSNEGVLTNDGVVTRSETGDENVTLTALVVLGEASREVMFNLVVKQVEIVEPPVDPGEGEGELPPTTEPTDPEVTDPVDPEQPEEPIVDPVDPPVEPEQPTEPEVEPTEPEQPPVEPEQPTEGEGEPTEPPVDPEVTEPTEPEVTEPVEPEVEPTEPTEPEVTEPEQPVEPTEPEVPVEETPTDPEIEPEQPTEPTEPEGEPEVPEETPTEPEVEPTEPVEPPIEEGETEVPEVEPTEPVEPPVEEGEVTEPETTEPTEPVEETPVDEGTPEGDGTPETNQTT